MSLRLKALDFRNFRNHAHLQVGDIGDLTVIVGRNAVGKTNVLEGIQLLTSTTSFRHPQLSELVKDGNDQARVEVECGDGRRELLISLFIEKGRKSYSLNGKRKPSSDIRGTLPSVVFVPDDLLLAKGSSGVKREALDDMGVQLSRNYHVIRKDFEKTVRYKNRLLRDEAPQPLVDAINETLITCGAQLFCYRHALFTQIVPLVSEQYGELAQEGERFEAAYHASWEALDGMEHGSDGVDFGSRDQVRERLARALDAHGREERARRRSIVGPHADKITFSVSGKDAAHFASQGQQRSIVLAWKLAEVEMVRRQLSVEPVLLLDDVMSELDEMRRNMLVRSVGSRTQAFITSTDLSPFDEKLLSHAMVIDLGKGSPE